MTRTRTTLRSRGQGFRGRRGFTLLEVLIVVVVLGILTVVAGIPASADTGAADLDLAQIQIQDAFVTAHTLAYSMGVPHGVVFDPDTERFAVVALDGTPARDPLTHADYVIDFKRVEQPAGVKIQSAEFGPTGPAGIYDAQGVPVSGGTVTLSKGQAMRTLSLDPATGKLSEF
jgi:prepilin-type N-terminal cleavage/methylation domain-containing protein